LAILLVPLATLLVFIALVGVSATGLSLRGMTTGSIKLDDVSLRQGDAGQWYLSAEADITLPEPIKAGLDSGVPLDFILSIEFHRKRRYWLDQTLADYRHRYRLTYYELTRHYRVYALDTDESRNYRSLSAALNGLGDFDRLPVVSDTGDVQKEAIGQALEENDATLVAALGFRLDSQSLPLPLQPLIASSWRLASEEYLWQID